MVKMWKGVGKKDLMLIFEEETGRRKNLDPSNPNFKNLGAFDFKGLKGN